MKTYKLVRDKIPEIIKNKGRESIVYVADESEYWEKLKEKLEEEVKEFKESENIEEMADILEVIDAMIAYKKFNKKEIESVKKKKAKERGRFEKRIILETA